MASVIITELIGEVFSFELDGVLILENKRNDLTIEIKSNIKYCHFKTSNGANILKKQDVIVTDVTVVSIDGDTSNPTTSIGLFQALSAIHYFDWISVIPGSGTSGATKFTELIDAFTFIGNDGKIPKVNESLMRLDAVDFYNYRLLTELQDVAISTLNAGMNGKRLGIGIVSGNAKVVLYDETAVDPKPRDYLELRIIEKGVNAGVPNTGGFVFPDNLEIGDFVAGRKDINTYWDRAMYKGDDPLDRDASYEELSSGSPSIIT